MYAEQPFAHANSAVQMLRGHSNSIHSNNSRPALSRQNSLKLQQVGGSPVLTHEKAAQKEEGHVNIGGSNPPAYKLETAAACQLVVSIYEDKVSIKNWLVCIVLSF